MKKIAILLIMCFALSCASTGPLYKDKITNDKLKIPVNNFTINIEDKRESKSARSLHINKITFGGEQDKVSAPPPKNLDDVFENIIEESKINGNRDIDFKVEILDGIQKFYATGFLEIEYVEVTINVIAIEKDTKIIIDQIESKSWGQKKTMDANNQRINRMYLNAFEDAFKKGISKLKLSSTQTESP